MPFRIVWREGLNRFSCCSGEILRGPPCKNEVFALMGFATMSGSVFTSCSKEVSGIADDRCLCAMLYAAHSKLAAISRLIPSLVTPRNCHSQATLTQRLPLDGGLIARNSV